MGYLVVGCRLKPGGTVEAIWEEVDTYLQARKILHEDQLPHLYQIFLDGQEVDGQWSMEPVREIDGWRIQKGPIRIDTELEFALRIKSQILRQVNALAPEKKSGQIGWTYREVTDRVIELVNKELKESRLKVTYKYGKYYWELKDTHPMYTQWEALRRAEIAEIRRKYVQEHVHYKLDNFKRRMQKTVVESGVQDMYVTTFDEMVEYCGCSDINQFDVVQEELEKFVRGLGFHQVKVVKTGAGFDVHYSYECL